MNTRPAQHRLRGAMLLEVVLALAILVSALAAIGIQMNQSLRTGYGNENLAQAMMLADAKMGQLDTGTLFIEREMEDEFGEIFPGYFWRFEIIPHDDIIDMYQVRLDILYGATDEDGENGNIDDAEIVATLHTIRPQPANLDLQRDFGLTEEQLDEIASALPPDIADPTDISPAMFAEMDITTLMELMPVLMENLGGDFNLTSEQMQQLMDAGMSGEIPTDLGDVQDLINRGQGGGGGGGEGGDQRGKRP